MCIPVSWMTAVLQGCRAQEDFSAVHRLLERLQFVVLGGSDVAVPAARNYRKLRSLGRTVRGTLDVALATRCIVGGYRLLHDERAFDVLGQHLRLGCVTASA